MIFLQCVGSVCRSRKRASYLQGGSEMIIRKKNNRKTKSSGHWALFSLLFFEHVANIIWEEEEEDAALWGLEKKDVQWQLSVTGSQVVLTEAQLLKLCRPQKTCPAIEITSRSCHWEQILITAHLLLKESHPSGCFIELWPWALVLSHLFW